jgi:hypothetical protein
MLCIHLSAFLLVAVEVNLPAYDINNLEWLLGKQ